MGNTTFKGVVFMWDDELNGRAIQQAADFLDHSRVMKDRDRDMDRAFKALHAATSRLLEVVLSQQNQINELQKVKK